MARWVENKIIPLNSPIFITQSSKRFYNISYKTHMNLQEYKNVNLKNKIGVLLGYLSY